MYDIYIVSQGKGVDTLTNVGKDLSKGQAKKAIDQLMAVRERPRVVAYRSGKYAYSRSF